MCRQPATRVSGCVCRKQWTSIDAASPRNLQSPGSPVLGRVAHLVGRDLHLAKARKDFPMGLLPVGSPAIDLWSDLWLR